MIELDSYIKHLILKDFIDVFFDNDDLLANVNMVKDLEIYSNELIRTMFILFDNCCRVYSTINNLKKDELNITMRILLNKLKNIEIKRKIMKIIIMTIKIIIMIILIKIIIPMIIIISMRTML